MIDRPHLSSFSLQFWKVAAKMDYVISGEENQTLQFILQPGHKLTIDMNSICWCNSAILLQSRGLFYARSLALNILIGDAINETTTPAILSLNQIGNGKVLVVNVDKPLYCFKDSFVCATEEVNVSPKLLPINFSIFIIGMLQLYHKAHYCTASSIGRTNATENIIFFQSGGTILMKELKAGESLTVKFNCMVAFEETCKVSVVNPFKNIIFIFVGKDAFLKVEGPGKVYFCAHSFARNAAAIRSRLEASGSLHTNTSILGFCLYLFALGFTFNYISSLLSVINVQAILQNEHIHL